MIHYMKLNPKPYEQIKNGTKTIELRLYDEKRRLIKGGDIIEFTNTDNENKKINVYVKKLYVYENFKQLYNELPMRQCGYKRNETADPEDMNKYYTPDQQQKYGVVGIEFYVLKSKYITSLGKFISLVLRHHPEAAGITLDEHGWADTDELIDGINKSRFINTEILEYIVETNNKQRYSFSDDKKLIRANQGHSIPVDVELKETKPPEILWHGTAKKYKPDIDKNGLLKMSRLYVHLSPEPDTAVSVGKRHGEPFVYAVDAKKMYADGFKFYRSVNNVWLTEYVPPEYLKEQT